MKSGLLTKRDLSPDGSLRPTARLIADELLSQLEKPFTHPDTGETLNGRQLLASMMLALLFTGKVTLTNGRKVEIAAKDWIETMKWIVNHIDGPARTSLDLDVYDHVEFVVSYARDALQPPGAQVLTRDEDADQDVSEAEWHEALASDLGGDA